METQPGLEPCGGMPHTRATPKLPLSDAPVPPGPAKTETTVLCGTTYDKMCRSPAAERMLGEHLQQARCSTDPVMPSTLCEAPIAHKRPSPQQDEVPMFSKKVKVASEEGCTPGPPTRAFCPACGTNHEAAIAEHWAAGRITEDTVAHSYNGRCTDCGCTWSTNRMPAEWGGGGCLQAWLYRPSSYISPAAVHELRRSGRQVDGQEHPTIAFRDPAVEARARMWMHCPVCGNDLQAIVLQNLQGQRTKWIMQYQCPGCVFEAHGTILRVSDYLSVSWMGRA